MVPFHILEVVPRVLTFGNAHVEAFDVQGGIGWVADWQRLKSFEVITALVHLTGLAQGAKAVGYSACESGPSSAFGLVGSQQDCSTCSASRCSSNIQSLQWIAGQGKEGVYFWVGARLFEANQMDGFIVVQSNERHAVSLVCVVKAFIPIPRILQNAYI